IYILDDYSPLRGLRAEVLARDCVLFPVKDALLYIQSRQYGLRGKGFQGSAFYTADNPPYGATFTYYLKETIKTRKQLRQDFEKEAEKKKASAPYPPPAQLRLEEEEEPPAILVTVTNFSGEVIRTLTGPVTQGFHRVSWNLRDPAASLPRPRAAAPD